MDAFTNVRRFVRDSIVYAETPREEVAAFVSHANRVMAQVAGGLAGLAFLVTVVWWPLDYLLYAQQPAIRHVMFEWRLGNLTTMGSLALLMALSKRAREHPVL